MVRLGWFLFGLLWHGRYVWAWLCGAVLGWVVLGMVRQARLGTASKGEDWRGGSRQVGRGRARLGMAS